MCPRRKGVLVARHSGVLLFPCLLKSVIALCLALITSELCPAFQFCSHAQGMLPFRLRACESTRSSDTSHSAAFLKGTTICSGSVSARKEKSDAKTGQS